VKVHLIDGTYELVRASGNDYNPDPNANGSPTEHELQTAET
jgi:hypothetical protein